MRRRGRECALQLLYQLDVVKALESREGSDGDFSSELSGFWNNFEAVGGEERAFAERLVEGVVKSIGDLDRVITQASRNWKLPRMADVDRNLLRLATYEILYCADIPRAASINEAVEIAKRFSGTEAASFINGVLDQVQSEP